MDILEKLQVISEEECNKMKRLPFVLWKGHVQFIFDKVGVPRMNPIPEEYFDAVINGIIDSFFGGCEPEFESEDDYDNYIKTVEEVKKLKWITITDKNYFFKSPYQDKTIPFLN